MNLVDRAALDRAMRLASFDRVTHGSFISRRLVAALVIFVLTLSGVGRGIASASDAASGVPGVTVHICHAGPSDDGSVPADQSDHSCCDACALLAPATLPAAPMLPGLMPAFHFASHAVGMAWEPTVARPRTPRQSQGPPAA